MDSTGSNEFSSLACYQLVMRIVEELGPKLDQLDDCFQFLLDEELGKDDLAEIFVEIETVNAQLVTLREGTQKWLDANADRPIDMPDQKAPLDTLNCLQLIREILHKLRPQLTSLKGFAELARILARSGSEYDLVILYALESIEGVSEFYNAIVHWLQVNDRSKGDEH